MKNPEMVAQSIFRLVDMDRKSYITYEELEEFLRYVFFSAPALETVLASFGDETIERLKFDGEKMYREVRYTYCQVTMMPPVLLKEGIVSDDARTTAHL